MKRLAIIALAACFMAAPAAAETDWTKYATFVGVKCNAPKTVADIIEALKGHTYDDTGSAFMSYNSGVEILSAATLKTTRDQLICRIKLRSAFNGSFDTRTGTFTVLTYKNKTQWTTRFVPGG